MTREEAIYRLKNTAWLGTDKDREETEQAIDMAIEALANLKDEFESADAVSREMREPTEEERASVQKYIDSISNDVVSVVRCKDCRWWNTETYGCNRNPCVEQWHEDDFCSYGERKEP